jgi:EAL domain-containing protein (putative c-di-GMP-specific phosphodiesterase class I)
MTSSEDPAGPGGLLVVSADAQVAREVARLAGTEGTDSSDVVFSVLGVEPDAGAALARVRAESPAVVVIDVDVLGGRAEAVIRAALRAAPSARVLALSVLHNRGHVMRMLSAGAAGCLVKGTGAEGLADGMRAALRGELVLPFGLAVDAVGEASRHAMATQARRTEIRDVVDRGSFQVAFQPVFDLEDLTVAGVEALARFDGASALRPDAWIAEAWALGLGLDLELAILSRAVGAADRLHPGVFLAVNVSLLALVTDRFREALSGVDGLRSIVAEVTQPLQPEDDDSLTGPMAGLRARGLRLALRAGEGTDLGRLQSLGPDILEVEVASVGDLNSDPERLRILRDLVRAAGDIGAAVAAVGIETATQLRTLRETGVAYGQGYLLARPEAQLDSSGL